VRDHRQLDSSSVDGRALVIVRRLPLNWAN
jgi:hypothetical protein